MDDLLSAEARGERVELLAGSLVTKEAAGAQHGSAHANVLLGVGPFQGRGGSGRPGGWVFRAEPAVAAPNGDVVAPDLAGWRRERNPTDDAFPITVAPDWVCEIVYSSHARDLGYKPGVYHQMRVGHYWVVDLKAGVLSVYRWTEPGHALVATAVPSMVARIEPFEALELNIWELFGLDDRPDVS